MINQVILVGRLTRDPELKFTNDGKAFTNITLAVTRQFRNPNGELDTDFVPCILWRKTAENTALYCQKGACIGVIGRIQTRNYENQEGKRVYVTEVVADNVQFLSKKSRSEQQDHQNLNQDPHHLRGQEQEYQDPHASESEHYLQSRSQNLPQSTGLEQHSGRMEERESEVEPFEPIPR
jgi:single-strand DNA-binding protein